MVQDVLEQPPGSRSCRIAVHGTRPDVPYEWSSVPALHGRRLEDAFHRKTTIIPPYSTVQLAEISAKITRLEKKATLGKLKIGPGIRNQVGQSEQYPNVLYLRFGDIPHDCDEVGMWLRIYFTEPHKQGNALRRLYINCKVTDDSEYGAGENLQTEDMRIANANLLQDLK